MTSLVLSQFAQPFLSNGCYVTICLLRRLVVGFELSAGQQRSTSFFKSLLEDQNRGFESQLRPGCLEEIDLFVFCCVQVERPRDGLVPRPSSPTNCV